MNGFDLSTVTNIYLGSTPVKEVYMGTKLIWPTETDEYATEYFTIESVYDNNQIGIVDSDRPSIEISTDKQNWDYVSPYEAPTYFITLNAGEKVYIKGRNNQYYDSSWSTQGYFTSTGQFNVSGNIMSLKHADDFKNKTTLSSSNEFAYLFYNTNIKSAEHLVLPATKLMSNCYEGMFQNCASLTKAPALPATILEYECYISMFKGCSSLTKAPELPATTAAYDCYKYMFQDCYSLTTPPPELPATTLAISCYESMFQDCWLLTTAPKLPAINLTMSCYSSMFQNCTSLTTAPELPATTLLDACYNSMFSGCSSLNYIKMLATDVSDSSCLSWWVYGVASSGTFVKDASTTLPTGINGIPDGWTVETV